MYGIKLIHSLCLNHLATNLALKVFINPFVLYLFLHLQLIGFYPKGKSTIMM